MQSAASVSPFNTTVADAEQLSGGVPSIFFKKCTKKNETKRTSLLLFFSLVTQVCR